jgi:hypothetical protein
VPCYAVPGVDRLDAFNHRLMNVEVEPAAREGIASEVDIERAAKRLGRHLLPPRST